MERRILEGPAYITVTELNRALNKSLEDFFPELFIQGEIGDITKAASGHLYFTLKDSGSQISCVMWAGLTRGLKFKPDKGVSVLCDGKPSLYHKTGRLQIVVHRMQETGEGALQKKFLELKAKLEKEGLFAQERKRSLPFLPRALGIVTSASGAVVHDIMVKIRERMPNLKVYLVDVRVQGEGAANEIANGIELLNRFGEVDVIIVGRGGGSLEDLWAFNEEVVVRAIFASRIPIVSAVGHEVDVSLSDLVADLRAPTPTAAAEIVVPKREDLLFTISELERRLLDYDRWFQPLIQEIDELTLRLEKRIKSVIEEGRLHLVAAFARLKLIEPRKIVANLNGRLDVLLEKITGNFQRKLGVAEQALERLVARQERTNPRTKLPGMFDTVKYQEAKFQKALFYLVGIKEQALHRLSTRLESVSPKAVLGRGYSVVECRGEIVRSVSSLSANDSVSMLFHDGGALALVKETYSDDEREIRMNESQDKSHSPKGEII